MDYYNPVIDYYNAVYNLLLRFKPCLNQLGLILILSKININPIININPNTNPINIKPTHYSYLFYIAYILFLSKINLCPKLPKIDII